MASPILHERNQVRRVVRVPHQHALRVQGAGRLDRRGQQSRRAAGDDHLRVCRGVELGHQSRLEREVLGPALLHERRAARRLARRRREGELREVGPRGRAERVQHRPRRLDRRHQAALGPRGGVARHDAVSVREEERGPAHPDDAGAHDGDVALRHAHDDARRAACSM